MRVVPVAQCDPEQPLLFGHFFGNRYPFQPMRVAIRKEQVVEARLSTFVCVTSHRDDPGVLTSLIQPHDSRGSHGSWAGLALPPSLPG